MTRPFSRRSPAPMYSLSLGSTMLLWALTQPAQAQSQPEPKTYNYRVQEGDTCVGIAKKELGDPKAYHTIHHFNPDMGPTPHKLHPGELLKMPLPQHPDAEITAIQKKVEARSGQVGAWTPALPGLAMYRGWRVQTFDASFADLRFVDTSTLSMSPNTMVVIYGPRWSTNTKAPARASLDHGSLRARLSQLGGRTPALEISTPSSTAQFEGGESLVEVAKDGESRIENHGDGVAEVSGQGSLGKVKLPKATGTKVKKGKRPLPPRPLPPTPRWKGQSLATFATSTQGGNARGHWEGVSRAVAYRVELQRYTKQSAAPETVNVFLQDASTQGFHLSNLKPGRYAVTVSAVDDQDFTSIPSATQRFEVHKVALKVNGRNEPFPNGFGDPIRVPHGAQLQLPKQARCVSPSIGLAHPEGLIVSGTHEVRCTQSNGQAMEPWTLVVDAPDAKSSGPQRVHLLRAQESAPRHAREPRFDVGAGSSMWLLQRGQTDPLALGSTQRLPTVFFDLSFRYLPLSWLSVGLSQHMSSPRSYQRSSAVVLGVTAQVDVVYNKWKVWPMASLHGGIMGLVGSAPNGTKSRSIPAGLDLGIQAPIAYNFSLRLKTGVLRVVQTDLSAMYTTVRIGAQLSYRFGLL